MSPIKCAAANPLSERSPNMTSPSKSRPADKVKLDDEMNNSSKLVMPRFEEKPQQSNTTQGQNTTYISPSDAIRSPTTKKLSEIKGRRFMKGKPQTLFARTLTAEGLKSRNQQELNQRGTS